MPKKKTVYLKDYKVPSFLVEKLDLDFDLYDTETIVISTAIYYKNSQSKEKNILNLFGEQLELISIFLDGNQFFDYKKIDGGLVLENVADRFELKIITKIHPEKNTALEGLYMSEGKFCTQNEPEGFRRMTYYLDRPDVMTVFTTKITADKKKYPVLLSNGNLVKVNDVENGRHFAIWNDPFKKPSYLFALVAGNLEHIEDKFITMSGREITLRIFTESHNIKKCDFAMQSLKKAMKWDEDRFGLEYDLDLFMIVAVDDFNMGAMENKGLNIFNSNLVFATPESATDNDYIYIERVIGHEYFHNWTGNRVTCRDWFQLSLKEGLTVYRDSEFTADMQSRSVKRIDDVKYLRDTQFKEDAGPMAHPIRPSSFEEINNFYTVTVYEKGAEVIKMYEVILSREGFRKGMDLYFKRHDGQAVTTEDFLASMQDANNIDLSQFQIWYDQAGTPLVEVESNYNETDKNFTIKFKQSCRETSETKEKKPFIIPIKFGLIKQNGEEIKLDSNLIILTKKEEIFTFENIESEPVPSFLRNFSAPINLNYNYSTDDFNLLMKYDSDDFAKFEATFKYATSIILDLYKTGKREISSDFIESFGYILNNIDLDNSFKAEVLSLPSEGFIFNTIGKEVDPGLIFEIREFFMQTLAKKFSDKFEKLYNILNDGREYKMDSKNIGDRKLKNLSLLYLSYLGKEDIAYNAYKNSNNMTDTMVSFSCLIDMDSKYKDEVLQDFYSKWKDDNNVMNKWFAIQAKSKSKTTLENIKKLEKHKSFDTKNPNKIKSLFNAFAYLNTSNFHRADGEGYKYIADKVIEINKFNPLIAARLARSLIDWKSLEQNRGQKLKGELERIFKEDLSADLYEVIDKSLS